MSQPMEPFLEDTFRDFGVPVDIGTVYIGPNYDVEPDSSDQRLLRSELSAALKGLDHNKTNVSSAQNRVVPIPSDCPTLRKYVNGIQIKAGLPDAVQVLPPGSWGR